MMSKILYTGGSITAGTGWDLTDPVESTYPWVAQMKSKIKSFNQLEVINLGIPGPSNEKIFTNTVKGLADHSPSIKYLFCSWVSGPRYEYHLGFELYDTRDTQCDRTNDLGVNGFTIPADYINNIKKRFFALHHVHYEIVKIVRYANIITNLAKQLNVTAFHINDSCPWDAGFFNKKDGLPSGYTKFTQDHVLNISTRCDEEIFQLYDKMHQDYNNEGGISGSVWINIDNSFTSLQIDTNNDNVHPGHQSTQIYSDIIKQFLNNQGIY